jgi:AraC family transcriptional regulator of adaptative response / DNA-3-methyladenine glycosylase II
VADGALVLEPGVDVAGTMARLRHVRGIGDWTAHYIAMRALAWPDAFPDGDVGVMTALGERRRALVREQATQWQPWRACAVMHLWRDLAAAPSASGDHDRAAGARRPVLQAAR